MKIQIQRSAQRDLIDGYRFYEKQAEGLGTYFLDTLFSDIDSLMINAGIHQVYFEKYYRLLSKRFPFAVYYLIVLKIKPHESMPFLIAEDIRHGQEKNLAKNSNQRIR